VRKRSGTPPQLHCCQEQGGSLTTTSMTAIRTIGQPLPHPVFTQPTCIHVIISGQNLGLGFNNWTELILAWYDEKKDFTYNSQETTGVVGHFTQVRP